MRAWVCLLVIVSLLCGSVVAVAAGHSHEGDVTAGALHDDGTADRHGAGCDHLCCHPGVPTSPAGIQFVGATAIVAAALPTFADRPPPVPLEPPRLPLLRR